MSRVRRLTAAALLLTVLGTFGVATFGSSDMAGSPSYFDGRDDDAALWLLVEGLPGLLVPGQALVVVLVACFASSRGATSPRFLAPPLPARLRAPPLR
jgi:hypothetical protein